jgi:hypothetical protein
MNERIAYLSQIVDKIGTPLLLPILESTARAGTKGGDVLKDEAQKLAELLSRTVMLSIDLGKMIEIEKSTPEHTESLRVAMAGLASPIVGRQYMRLKKPPTESELKKVSGALEAVLTFADNFSPSPENALRLNLLNATATPSDAHQITIQYLQAFVPVADVIAAFPFGQPEKKLIQEVADRINERAKTMISYVFGDNMDDEQKKLSELAFVKSLAELYSTCHKHEMERLVAMRESDPAIQQKGMANVWENFDTRSSMLETLAASLTPDHPGRIRSAPQTANEPPQMPQAPTPKPPTAEQPIQMQPPPVNTPEPIHEQPLAEASVQSTGNPMALFAKPKEHAQPAQELLPAQNAAPVPPPDQIHAQTYEQPVPHSQNEEALEQQSASTNPMAFFKIPPQDQQDE